MDRKKLTSKRRSRLAVVAALGILAGYGCTFMPPQFQAPCLLGAKLLGIVFGG